MMNFWWQLINLVKQIIDRVDIAGFVLFWREMSDNATLSKDEGHWSDGIECTLKEVTPTTIDSFVKRDKTTKGLFNGELTSFKLGKTFF